uniref:Boule n=1 Tax=Athalia rosae TaxID=37344 RepID=K7ZPX1_ATHRO|nr:boule [Athalia rosae]BAM66422.1 boule [Athalia rosae]
MSSASTGGTEGSSPASSPASAVSLAMAAPKYGTLVPNRIFVGGISASTSEAELAQLFSTYGNVKGTKIISDRAGVSKGYGFVTFETEEEAKRLQQESECIVLRERKLNIAPAIKKQLFNRSFDGSSGSPPAVPTSTYYYTNGMGLAYQNGMTFYNTGGPAPATPVAPQADPTTLYQATSVFGPQATAGHQTFAPVMYPCPAPSLYVPQPYPYSPMPYEPYYAGAAAAGAPQYLYATNSSQNTSNGGGGSSGGGTNGTGATSPPVGPPPAIASLAAPPQTHHFYAPGAPPPHHHPPVPAGPPQPQVDHLYYSFAAGPPPPPPPHTQIGLADQQLLLYTTDGTCQPQQSNDSQGQPQEVQFYAPTQNRYQPAMPPPSTTSGQQQQQQQQQPAQRRYTAAPPVRRPSEKYPGTPSQGSMLRQHKYKTNGLMQAGGKSTDDSLGGAGDAPPGVGRMPLTPPGTPRNNHPAHSTTDQNQINDTCHQIQALSL